MAAVSGTDVVDVSIGPVVEVSCAVELGSVVIEVEEGISGADAVGADVAGGPTVPTVGEEESDVAPLEQDTARMRPTNVRATPDRVTDRRSRVVCVAVVADVTLSAFTFK